MDLRRFSPFAFLAAVLFLTGCLTRSKPAELPKSEPTEAKQSEPADPTKTPMEPALKSKYEAFLTMQGLAAPTGQIGQSSRLTTGWDHHVAFASDPMHGGNPVPGLVARVYIFGPDESLPLVPEGDLVAGVWDLSRKTPDGEPVLLELWHIDVEKARKFRKRDAIGEGYSIFLPWSTYHVDLKQINVMIRYNGADGRSLSSAPQMLTLDHSATLQRAAEKLGTSGKGADQPKLPVTFGPTK